MDKHTFMKLHDVSWQDYHAQDPDAIGMITIILRKDDNDDLDVQMGANVAPGVVRYAMLSLTADLVTGRGLDIVTAPPPKLRKAV